MNRRATRDELVFAALYVVAFLSFIAGALLHAAVTQ